MTLTRAQEMDVLVGEVLNERMRQDAKWGWPRHLDATLWSTVLLEEVGEVARAVLERDRLNLRQELVQVAAVALAWLERGDWERGGNDA